MKLHVVHRSAYRYAAPVTQNLNEVRLKPVSADGQICESFALDIKPVCRLSSYVDFYFNYVQFFEVQDTHDSLSIESVSVVTTTNERRLPCDATTAPLTRLPETLRLEQCYDFTQPTSLVANSPEVWRLAVDACMGQSDIWQSSVAIMRFIHSRFTYDPSATNVNTHMIEVLQQQRGVCQDFAHVMLGMCRAMRIPARYVSGYLYNGPADQLTGAQASHAWCEVFVPDLGWRALDPTNNQPADERYIKVAVGRDYADAAPIKGNYKGTADRELAVEVQVTAL
jgi:transglutaminase-like putative cysteine protease